MTAATNSRGILYGGISASIALSGAGGGLVDDLGRRLRFPVRVEL